MRLIRKRNSESGFSLLEVIIAMGILAVGLLGVALAQLSAVRLAKQSRYLTHSMNLAQQQMEVFQFTPNAALPASGTYADPNNPIDADNLVTGQAGNDESSYNRRWIIAAGVPFAGTTTIQVMVDWVDNNGNVRTTTLESVRGL